MSYKSLCTRIADFLLEISPEFPYPRTLASTLVETANNTLYFAEHLPRLTDIKYQQDRRFNDEVIQMLEYLAFAALKKPALKEGQAIRDDLNGQTIAAIS